MKRRKPIERLMAAMDRCALARGEVQWTHGYRTAKGAHKALLLAASPEDRELYLKEQRQWKEVDRAEKAYKRLALQILNEVVIRQSTK